MGKFKLYVQPARLLRWLDERTIRSAIVLLDLEPSVEVERQLQLKLNVVLNTIRVRRGWLRPADCYIACTGALVEVALDNGEIVKSTGGRKLDVSYKYHRKGGKSHKLGLSPKIKVTGGTEMEPGGIELSKKEEIATEASWSTPEDLVLRTDLGARVRWELQRPSALSPLRSFLAGNVWIDVLCKWNVVPGNGAIYIRPDDISCFGPNRRPVGRKAALIIRAVLWKSGIKLMYDKGLDIRFSFQEVVADG